MESDSSIVDMSAINPQLMKSALEKPPLPMSAFGRSPEILVDKNSSLGSINNRDVDGSGSQPLSRQIKNFKQATLGLSDTEVPNFYRQSNGAPKQSRQGSGVAVNQDFSIP